MTEEEQKIVETAAAKAEKESGGKGKIMANVFLTGQMAEKVVEVISEASQGYSDPSGH